MFRMIWCAFWYNSFVGYSITASRFGYLSFISPLSIFSFKEFIEDKGIAILGDIGTVLKDLQKAKEKSAFEKTYKGLQGWGDRFEKASLKSMVGGGRIDAANTAADHVNIMKKAYELGKNI